LALGAVPYSFDLGQVFITAEKRRYPLRIERPEAWEDDVRISLPAGYRLGAQPRDARFEGPGASYTVEYTVNGDELEIRRRLFVAQGDISPRAYRAFVRFCRDVDAWEKEELKLTPVGGP
jgi:hypothetical protein